MLRANVKQPEDRVPGIGSRTCAKLRANERSSPGEGCVTGARSLLGRFRSLIGGKRRAARDSGGEEPTGSGRRAPPFFDRDAPVFFVVGQGKSGTTWIRNALNAHPEILCRGEGRFFERDFVRVAPPEDLRRGWLKSVQPTSLYGAISSSQHLRTWIERSVWTDGDDVDEHLGNLERLAVNYFLTRRLSKTDKKIVGDKTTFSGGEVIEEIGALCPEAK